MASGGDDPYETDKGLTKCEYKVRTFIEGGEAWRREERRRYTMSEKIDEKEFIET